MGVVVVVGGGVEARRERKRERQLANFTSAQQERQKWKT